MTCNVDEVVMSSKAYAKLLLETSKATGVSFSGVKVRASNLLPDGYFIFMQNGKVISVFSPEAA